MYKKYMDHSMIVVSEKIDNIIQEFKYKLVEEFGENIEVILFGSFARGDNVKESDIDLLVLLPFDVSGNMRMQIFDVAYEIEFSYDVVLNVIPYSTTLWSSKKNQVTPFYKSIISEGKKI